MRLKLQSNRIQTKGSWPRWSIVIVTINLILENFYINPAPLSPKDDPQGDNENFLIVRSLKNKDGIQKVPKNLNILQGYTLEPGDILKLGRIVNKFFIP